MQPPTFGSATAFGGEKGFGGFAAAAAQASRDATSFPSKSSGDAAGEEEDQAAGEGEEEECKAEFQPLVQLEEVATSTGEEDEDVFFQVCVQREHRNRNRSGKAAVAIHAKDGADKGQRTSHPTARRSCIDSTQKTANGRNEALAWPNCCSTAKARRSGCSCDATRRSRSVPTTSVRRNRLERPHQNWDAIREVN